MRARFSRAAPHRIVRSGTQGRIAHGWAGGRERLFIDALVERMWRAPLTAPDPLAFDTDTLRILARAYENALTTLELAGSDTQYRPGDAAAARHRLAQQIVQMGRAGERDPDRLRVGALGDLRRNAS
jgi:hypothetical protein